MFRLLLAVYAAVFLALAISPVERDTWFAENLTVWIIVAALVILRRRGVTFTPLAYTLMFVLVILHTIGGHYTFARVPFGWVTDLFGFQRNHYDRVAHFSVGLYAFAIAEWLDTRRLVANRLLLALCPGTPRRAPRTTATGARRRRGTRAAGCFPPRGAPAAATDG
jgi:putative membrane protein